MTALQMQATVVECFPLGPVAKETACTGAQAIEMKQIRPEAIARGCASGCSTQDRAVSTIMSCLNISSR
jgi:hypothetical protein